MSKIKNIISFTLPGLVLGFLVARCGTIFPEHSSHPPGTEEAASADNVWTCSMHPQFQFPEQTPCPICGMELIPIDPFAEGLGDRQIGVSAEAAALAEIQTVKVERREVNRELRLMGKLAWDESNLSSLTAWTGGRIDRMHITTTGEKVISGQAMVDIWSPELNSAQQELLEAEATAKRMANAPNDSLRRTAEATLEAGRYKLEQLGMDPDAITKLLAGGSPANHITLRAASTGVVVERLAAEGEWVTKGQPLFRLANSQALWVLLEAHESELAWLELGQSVSLRAEAIPGKTYIGTIIFIAPVLDPLSRTVEVRVSVSEQESVLKPGMFVRAVVNAPYNSADGNIPLTIPVTAPLQTGKRAVVYLKVPDQDRLIFEGREIVLGVRAGDRYVVLEGLEEGDEVVVNGAFKIDSALQIQAKPSMMSLGGTVPGEDLAVPDSLREQLGQAIGLYLDLRIALANDDFDLASPLASSFVAALDSIDSSVLTRETLERWEPLVARIRNGAAQMAAAGEIEELRVGFNRTSEGLIQTIDLFGYIREGGPLKIFFCPMAFNDVGAEWLQVKERLANPYFGASMLRCGEMRRELSADKKQKGTEENN
ncbi:MAG: efflux transporter periplasmic adaptor subunit [Planctomycetota bacterium]|nr:MAG: efflux transporter periplasmic adaptor subunit [Planctomycetota bacterium]